MADEQLIELVRQNVVLYDVGHEKYLDKTSKSAIWNKIGKELKSDGAICKSRWNNIRDNFRRSLQRLEAKSGQKRKYDKNVFNSGKFYKYHSQLVFLKPYFKKWQPSKSLEDGQEVAEITTSEDEAITSCPANKEVQSSFVYAPSASPSSPGQTSPLSSPNHNPSSSKKRKVSSIEKIRQSRLEKSRNSNSPKTASALLLQYVLENNESKTSREQDPVDAFLAGVAPSLKSLSPYYFHLAKSEIFAIVQKYELNMLTEHNQE